MPWDQDPGLRCPGDLVPGFSSKTTARLDDDQNSNPADVSPPRVDYTYSKERGPKQSTQSGYSSRKFFRLLPFSFFFSRFGDICKDIGFPSTTKIILMKINTHQDPVSCSNQFEKR